MPKTCIIVPCYNESGRLNAGEFLEWARREPELHFLFVNDGSTDGTIEPLVRLSGACPERIRSIEPERNGGKAGAVRRGFPESFDSGYDVIGYRDADLATRDRIVEYPLERWEDVPGSKLKGRDFSRGAWEFLKIGYWLPMPWEERRYMESLQEGGGVVRK